MKTLLLSLMLTFFITTSFYAQTIRGLELHFKSKTPKIELFKELWLEAYLINKSTTTIKMFRVGYSEPGWNGYKEKWEGTLNGNPMKFDFFLDGASSNFSVKSIVDVLPGDSIYAGLLRYTVKSAGKYKITYTLSQDPTKVYIGFAANPDAASKAKQISTFSVTTKPFEFSVEDIKMGETVVKDISEEELAKKTMCYNLETAFSNPSDVYKLTVSDNITNEVLLKICSLKNLKVLYFDGASGFDAFPDQLGQLNLVDLMFRRMDNIKLPESLSNLKLLKKLSFDIFKITEFPKFIEKLSNLEILKISGCPIVSVPDEIAKLKHLKELYLTDTKITELNPKVSLLSSLEKLSVSSDLTSFPAIYGCTNLKYLEVSYNKSIKVIPAEIGQLKQLEEFHMAITGITAIPKEISNLKNLRIFELSNNKITEIPAELYECSSIQRIDLSNNQISTVAPGIDKLSNLTEFVAYKNNIEKLPVGLSKCPKIATVWVHTNKISGSDKEGKALEKKLGKKYCYIRQH